MSLFLFLQSFPMVTFLSLSSSKVLDYEALRCNASTQIDFNITNHGLLRADNVAFSFPDNHPELTFIVSPHPDHLAARSWVIVQVVIQSTVPGDCGARRSELSENSLIVPRQTSVRKKRK